MPSGLFLPDLRAGVEERRSASSPGEGTIQGSRRNIMSSTAASAHTSAASSASFLARRLAAGGW